MESALEEYGREISISNIGVGLDQQYYNYLLTECGVFSGKSQTNTSSY